VAGELAGESPVAKRPNLSLKTSGLSASALMTRGHGLCGMDSYTLSPGRSFT
jgi:hypothetical protein